MVLTSVIIPPIIESNHFGSVCISIKQRLLSTAVKLPPAKPGAYYL